MMPGNVPDLSHAEIVDFDTEGGESKVRLKLKDGVVIEVKMHINQILRTGNDATTGLPIYAIQATNIIRVVSCPPELRKTPTQARAGGKDSKNLPGFS